MALDTWVLVDPSTDPNTPLGSNEYRFVKNNGSGKASFAPDGSTSTITYACNYYYVENFVAALLGTTTYGSGSTLFRTLPDPHPFYWNFYASRCDVDPEGIASNVSDGDGYGPIWKLALVTAVYTPATYLMLSDGSTNGSELNRYVTREYDSTVDYLTTTDTFKWPSGAPLLGVQPGFAVPSHVIKYTWHQIPVGSKGITQPPNFAYYTSLMGKVNSVAFDGNDIGTCLFVRPEAKLVLPNVATSNNYYYDISYYISIRPNGQNKLYNVIDAAWETITSSTGGNPPYASADLNGLFSPANFV